MPAVPPIVPPSFGELARQAIARATTAAPAPVLVPRRIPPGVAGVVVVSLALGLELWRQWQEAVDAPIQGPPVPQGRALSPADNGPRATPAGTELQQLGSYSGRWDPTSGSNLVWTMTLTYTQLQQLVPNGPCTFNTSGTATLDIQTPSNHVPYLKGIGPGCGGFSEVQLRSKPRDAATPDLQIDLFGGDSFLRTDAVSFFADVGSVPNAQPITTPFVGVPHADPTDVARGVAGTLAPPPPRSLGTPIGAPLPQVASGSAVGAGGTAADIGVPVAAIPTTPSIAPVGAATSALGLSQTAAQAAAIAAAAAALAGQGIGSLTGAGGIALPVPGAIPQTGIETVFGGVAIGTIAQAVPATIAAVASEVGKIEQKLEIMSRMPAIDVDPEDWLTILRQIYDYFVGLYPTGSYQIEGPCELPDEDGNPPDPLVATWAAGSGGISEINSKVDALAVLLQHHKNLKQPTCGRVRPGPGGGVTVNFEEIL